MWTILQDIWRGVVIFYGMGNLIAALILFIKGLSDADDLPTFVVVIFIVIEFVVVAYFCFSWLGWI